MGKLKCQMQQIFMFKLSKTATSLKEYSVTFVFFSQNTDNNNMYQK